MGFWDGSGVRWTVCKQSTLLQTDNHTNTSSLNFYRPDALPDTQLTSSKHWRQFRALKALLHYVNRDVRCMSRGCMLLVEGWQHWCVYGCRPCDAEEACIGLNVQARARRGRCDPCQVGRADDREGRWDAGSPQGRLPPQPARTQTVPCMNHFITAALLPSAQ